MALAVASCSQDAGIDSPDLPNGDIKVNFTLELPKGEDVIYPTTRTTHDETEWTIKKLDLYQFEVTSDGNVTLADKNNFTDTDLKSIGGGSYTLAFTIPSKYYMQKRRFVFVANDNTVAATINAGTTYDAFCKTLASIQNENTAAASVFANPDTGIAMSGIAKQGSKQDIVLESSFQCQIHLTRIVARVDVVNHIPNMMITKIYMKKAAQKGYLMPQGSTDSPELAAPDNAYMSGNLDFNENAKNGSETPGYGTTYEHQYNAGAGITKSLYMYERENSEGNTASVVVEYTINGIKGFVDVPFQKTSEPKDYVNIQRNHLYKIVLGKGIPVTTDKVEVAFHDEPWNVIEQDSEVEVEQDKMNARLKVSIFTPYNVKSAHMDSGEVTFETEQTCASSTKFTQDQLQTKGFAGNNNHALFWQDAEFYRLPTQGEAQLLFPQSNYVYFSGSTHTSTTEFTETINLQNNSDGNTNSAGEIITGKSQLKEGTQKSTVNGTQFNIVYGYRLRGTDEYAAYRWEITEATDSQKQNGDKILKIRIKALRIDDTATTIDDIAQEDFWTSGYLEYIFPYSASRGSLSELWTSTKSYVFFSNTTQAQHGTTSTGSSYPIRLVKASEQDIATLKARDPYYGAQVGDFITKSGSLIKASQAAKYPNKEDIVAVVASINANRLSPGAVSKIKQNNKTGVPRGLAFGLKTLGGQPWRASGATSLPRDKFPYATTNKLAYESNKGYEITEYMISSSELTTHPIFNSLKSYRGSTPAPKNTSDWYIPAIGEWVDMIEGIGECPISNSWKTENTQNFTLKSPDGQKINYKLKNETFNRNLQKSGAPCDLISDSDHWSSTDYNEAEALTIHQDHVCANTKTPGYTARAVFAF